MPMAQPEPDPSSTRSAGVDWIRGVAIVLVVISHSWALWSLDRISSIPPLQRVVQSGNVAVTVFLVVAGFLLVRSLIGAEGRASDDAGHPGTIAAEHPLRAVVSRIVRISAQVWPVLLVVWLVATASGPNDLVRRQTEASLLYISTFRWNIYLQEHMDVARADLGHLWYTSVYVQVTIALVLIVAGLRRRRIVLALTLSALLLACTIWRAHTADVEPITTALLRTTTRMDGMLWGALLAVCWPWLTAARRVGPTLLAYGLGGYALLVVLIGNDASYLGWAGVAANVCVVLVILGSAGLSSASRLGAVLAWRPMVALGRSSLGIYVWHYPLFFAVARWLPDAGELVRVIVGIAVVAVAVVLSDRYVERPVSRWIDTRLRARPPVTSDDAGAGVDSAPGPPRRR